MADFNLIREAWIPVTGLDGSPGEVSLAELVGRAPDLLEIATPLPTQKVAIQRLVVAMLARAVDGPPDSEGWLGYWQDPPSLVDAFNAYAARVEGRFFLFDDVEPFYQVATLHTSNDGVSELSKLVADVPNGEPLFSMRSAADLGRVPPGEAALWLVHAMCFDPSGIKSGAVGDPNVRGGKGYPQGVAWGGMIGSLMAVGANLHQTLLLNLVPTEAVTSLTPSVSTGKPDLPSWERAPVTAQPVERLPDGPIDLLTWQSRRIRLFGSRDDVTGVLICNGDPLAPQKSMFRYEPFTAWRYSKPQSAKHKRVVFMPQEHDPQRQVWRGITRLLPPTSPTVASEDDHRPPTAPVVKWLATLATEHVVPGVRRYRLSSAGASYGAQSSTLADVFSDELALPAVVFAEARAELRRAVTDMVEASDAAVGALANLARNLARAAGGEGASSADQARVDGYAALDGPIRGWMAGLVEDTDAQHAKVDWHTTCHAIVGRLGEELLRAAPPTAWTGDFGEGQRGVDAFLADAWFRARLNKELALARRQVASPRAPRHETRRPSPTDVTEVH